MTLFDTRPAPSPVDMHCHLADSGGYRSATPGALLLAVTNDPAAWTAMHDHNVPNNVTWALGLHPCELTTNDSRLPGFLDAMDRARAIGEIGLDYSARARCPRSEQRSVLDTILARPEARDRIVTLHSVRATADLAAAVAHHDLPGAVLHWFLGSPADINTAIHAEAYYSVNAAMLRSRRGRAALDEMPPNRVLTETDAPYATSGTSVTRPGQIEPIERGLARMWNLDPTEVRQRIWSNLEALQSRLRVQTFRTR